MSKHKVLRHFDLDGETVAVGSEVELSADQATEFADFIDPNPVEEGSTTGEETNSGADVEEGEEGEGSDEDDEDEEDGEGEGEGEGEGAAE